MAAIGNQPKVIMRSCAATVRSDIVVREAPARSLPPPPLVTNHPRQEHPLDRSSELCSSTVTEFSAFGQWPAMAEGNSLPKWLLTAQNPRMRPALSLVSSKVEREDTERAVPGTGKTTGLLSSGEEGPEMASNLAVRIKRQGSGPSATEGLTATAPFIVNLDSRFDDESQSVSIIGFDLTEEEQRMRYFEAMEHSLDRRFSDVVQLQPEVELDSDDEGEYHESLITPGTFAEPDDWLARTPRAGTWREVSSEPTSKRSETPDLSPLELSTCSPPECKTPQTQAPSTCKTPKVLQQSSPNSRSGKAVDLSSRSLAPKIIAPYDLPLLGSPRKGSSLEVSRSGFSVRAAASRTVNSGDSNARTVSVLEEDDFQRHASGHSHPHTLSLETSYRDYLPGKTSTAIPEKTMPQPLLSPRGLGIVCSNFDLRQTTASTAKRRSLTRSVTEPVLANQRGLPRSTYDIQEDARHASRQQNPIVEARSNKIPLTQSDHLNDAFGIIDIPAVCMPLTALPPLPTSARRASIILPPNAIKTLASPVSPPVIDCGLARNDHHGESAPTRVSQGTREAYTVISKPKKVDYSSTKSSHSPSRLQRNRRSALHPTHPYALEADSFASAFAESLTFSEPTQNQKHAVKHNGCYSLSSNKPSWPWDLTAQQLDERLQMPASQSQPKVPNRPRLHSRYTDSLLASSSYRKDSYTAPSAPKLPWHRMFDGPFPSRVSDSDY